jgi:hypothetical protein
MSNSEALVAMMRSLPIWSGAECASRICRVSEYGDPLTYAATPQMVIASWTISTRVREVQTFKLFTFAA